MKLTLILSCVQIKLVWNKWNLVHDMYIYLQGTKQNSFFFHNCWLQCFLVYKINPILLAKSWNFVCNLQPEFKILIRWYESIYFVDFFCWLGMWIGTWKFLSKSICFLVGQTYLIIVSLKWNFVGMKMSTIFMGKKDISLGFSTILIFSNCLLYIIMHQTKAIIKVCVLCTL